MLLSLDIGFAGDVTAIHQDESQLVIALGRDGDLIPIPFRTGPGAVAEIALKSWQLSFGDPALDAGVAAMLEMLRSGSESACTSPMVMHRRDGSCVHIDLVTLPAALRSGTKGAHFLLVIKNVCSRETAIKVILRKAFELTNAEAELALCLTKGLSINEASAKLGISIWTSRSHLRTIFQKTRTHRQGELISLVGRMGETGAPFPRQDA